MHIWESNLKSHVQERSLQLTHILRIGASSWQCSLQMARKQRISGLYIIDLQKWVRNWSTLQLYHVDIEMRIFPAKLLKREKIARIAPVFITEEKKNFLSDENKPKELGELNDLKKLLPADEQASWIGKLSMRKDELIAMVQELWYQHNITCPAFTL